MSTLYDLTGAYEELLTILCDGEEDEQCIFDTLEAVEGEIEDKADGYAKVIRSLESDIKEIKEEESRLASRRKSIEGNIQRVKKHLFDAMKFTGKTKFKTALYSFGIAKNGGKQPLEVDITDPLQLPEQYRKVEYKVDNEAIREALDEGVPLPFARLRERGESLRIR